MNRLRKESSASISTHAPAGGATELLSIGLTEEQAFLLTPLREGRHWFRKPEALSGTFLLTPLREGRRQNRGRENGSYRHFYSRPCGRGDQEALNQCFRFINYTHAPAGGATSVPS